jgi:radical SAM superfamily enzyme YgiQ (UPF0313 family)
VIILATLNAKYIHASFGLRYLRANLGALRDQSVLMEFTINERPIDIAERLLAQKPAIIGLGVYIWNVTETLAVVRIIKKVAPQIKIVLGGPEVSHETMDQEIVRLADYTITGEGEVAFAELAGRLLDGKPHLTKVIVGGQPDVANLVMPYDEYSDDDLAHRVLYFEASRGCPFECEFCLSSLDEKVRNFPLDTLLAALDRLAKRGAKQFKFVDRTFNLSPKISGALLDFFLQRKDMGLFAHFEMVPDRFPEALRERLAAFAPGAVQLEVGIQSFDVDTAARISRRQNFDATMTNLAWLHEHTGAHVHADLIVGLPGEDIASFARGFDRLALAGPHEIQVGILKRLRGTPIIRHDADWDVVWSAEPPYEILQNKLISFADMQKMKRFARAWDMVANRGNFVHTTPLLWTFDGVVGSPFAGFAEFADWLSSKTSLAAVSLVRLTDLIRDFLVAARGMSQDQACQHMAQDFAHPGASIPKSLQPFVITLQRSRRPAADLIADQARPVRQAKHHRE